MATKRARSKEQAAIDLDRRKKRLHLEPPSKRPLKAYAFDPSEGTLLGNRMRLGVAYEALDPGPVIKDKFAWNGVAVVDYDASNDVYYEPVDLEDPGVLIRGGLDPIEADPRFHQQMVYAVATDTVRSFEAALGRRIHWYRAPWYATHRGRPEDSIYTLGLYPHAMVSANAFYSRKAHGILFGYFRADAENAGRNIPGQTVFTCLSHDIIVHETTHAILDGIRERFTVQTNPDVAAFHEAFADLAALFRHFSHQEVLIDAIQRSGGMLFERILSPDASSDGSSSHEAVERGAKAPSITAQLGRRNPLVELAQQFGEATGRGRGLRSALDAPPNSTDIETVFEPHARGAILVAAAFDAYFTIYLRRTADLFRIYRAGGRDVGLDIPVPLARALAEKASHTADQFFRMCVRALDYCPPVDITFGDFLRAVITADFDIHPSDPDGVRDAFMQAFRVRGIMPTGAAFFSDAAIAWPVAHDLPPIPNLSIGDPNGLDPDEQYLVGKVLRAYLDDPLVREEFARQGILERDVPFDLPSFHPLFRIGEDGALRTEIVVEVIQERLANFDTDDGGLGQFPVLGGATLIISMPTLVERRHKYYATSREDQRRRRDAQVTLPRSGTIRYAISKQLGGDEGSRREHVQRAHLQRLGLVEGNDPERFRIDFALTHGGH